MFEEGNSNGGGQLTLDKLKKLEATNVCFAPNILIMENLGLFYKDDEICNLNPF